MRAKENARGEVARALLTHSIERIGLLYMKETNITNEGARQSEEAIKEALQAFDLDEDIYNKAMSRLKASEMAELGFIIRDKGMLPGLCAAVTLGYRYGTKASKKPSRKKAS